MRCPENTHTETTLITYNMERFVIKTQFYLWTALAIAALVGIFNGALSHFLTAAFAGMMAKTAWDEMKKEEDHED